MMTVTLHLGDCLEVMRDMEDKSVDCVLTDPPYGIGFQSNGAKVKRFDIIENDTINFDITPYYAEMRRLATKAIYLYCRYDIAHDWWNIIKPTSQIIIPRGRCSMGDLDNYSIEYEVMLYISLGGKIDATEMKIPNNSHAKNPPPFKRRIGNLWNNIIAVEAWERAQHPTQKTISSVSKAIKVSSNPGDTILDPFMGSGTTGVACVQTGRNFIGIEIDEKYHAIAARRIREAQQQPNLFHA